MAMVWNSGMGTPYVPPPPEPGRTYTPSTQTRTFTDPAAGLSAYDREYLRRMDEYIETIRRSLQTAAGDQREILRMQLDDAERGRQNAYRIAQLQDEGSRYGIDQRRQTELEQLSEQQRQFDANHGLEMQRFGLDVARAYTDYARTPDMRWSANDFDTAVRNIGLGGGPVPIAGQARPTPKSWEDFAALSGFNTPAVQAGQKMAPSPSGPGMASAAGAGTASDPRLTAATGILKALPPSGTPGHDDNDWAALEAIRSLYLSGRPGEVERLGRPRQKIAEAGLARLGYDPALVVEERRRSLPGQGSVRAA